MRSLEPAPTPRGSADQTASPSLLNSPPTAYRAVHAAQQPGDLMRPILGEACSGM